MYIASIRRSTSFSINAMVAAETMEGINGNKAYGLPHNLVADILKKYNRTVTSVKTIAVTSDDLVKYLGIYSSTEIALKITITKRDNILIAQATGQSSFELIPTDKDKFTFDEAGILLEFNAINKSMILKESGKQYSFRQE
jgi:hypothetical protein